jgi:hypothetical protein
MANIPISALPNVQPSGYTPNDLLVIVNSGTTSNTSLSSITSYVLGSFTGNTSASCISDLYVTNVHGCSPITIHDSVQSVGSQSTGTTSFAFGDNVSAFGNYSHAEGQSTQSIGDYSHAEGVNTISSGTSSHAEGVSTISPGDYSHAEGEAVLSVGGASHAEGYNTISSGQYSHSEGDATQSIGIASHSEGQGTISSGQSSHAEGFSTESIGNNSHAEGNQTQSIGYYSHSEGLLTQSIGFYSHSEGNTAISLGEYSHSEGYYTQSTGFSSHAEGRYTVSSGYYSHAEGSSTISSGQSSHAEGSGTTSVGNYSHAEGYGAQSIGDNSHAEGFGTLSIGNSSHAEGRGTIASGSYQHVSGQFNESGNTTSGAFIIGNGINNSSRSNLLFAAGNEVNISGKTITTNFQMTSGATDSYVLTSDSLGNGSWQLPTSFTGGTVTGDTIFTNGLTATTISGGTYYGDGTNLTNVLTGVTNVGTGITLSNVVGGNTLEINSITGDPLNKITTQLSGGTVEIGINEQNLSLWNLVVQGNKLLDGSVTWVSGLTFYVSDLQYLIAGTVYSASSTTVVLQSGDTNFDRIDVIYADTSSTVGVLAGNPSNNPEKPIVDGDTQVEVTFVSIPANSTGATVTGFTIYDENTGTGGGEWDFLAYGAQSSKFNPNFTGVTYSGSKSIRMTGVTSTALSSGFYLSASTPIDITEYSSLQFALRNINSLGTNSRLYISLLGAGGVVTSVYTQVLWNGATSFPNNISYNPTDTTTWQLISIPLWRFYASNNSIYGIIVKPYNSSVTQSVNLYLDKFQFVGGVPVNPPSNAWIGIRGDSTLTTLIPSSPNSTLIISGGTNIGSVVTSPNRVNLNLDNNIILSGVTANTISSTTINTVSLGTSANCVTDLYVTNVHGCSPITIHDSVQSIGSQSTGITSFAFGVNVSAFGNYSHAEGSNTQSIGYASHAEGLSNQSIGLYSHAEGDSTTSSGDSSHSEGVLTQSIGLFSHAEGFQSQSIGDGSHAEGSSTISLGYCSHSEGSGTTTSGIASHSQGIFTISMGVGSHAEGFTTMASGLYSHAEGNSTVASGNYSHAEGSGTIVSGEAAHAEGKNTQSLGSFGHAEGSQTISSGSSSHAQGSNTTSIGDSSHASGSFSTASGTTSFVHGSNSIAGGDSTIVLGDNITGITNNTTYVNKLNIVLSGTPSSSLDSQGENGSVLWDNNYFYWKANNQWLRISGSTW